jgi:hypothetical protein
MTQEQVLSYEVAARATAGQHGREQEPDEFEHALSIADFHSAEDLPSHRS